MWSAGASAYAQAAKARRTSERCIWAEVGGGWVREARCQDVVGLENALMS